MFASPNKRLPFYRKLVFIVLIGLLSACTGIVPDTGQVDPSSMQATQQAFINQAVQSTATISAMQTQIAQLQTQAAVTPTLPPPPTATQVPPTPTLVPTATPVPPTATPSIPCNQADFIGDVTVPDGSILTPGIYFSKTWRLRNIGSCTWNSDFDLVFTSGDSLGGPYEQALPGSVAPGQVVDLTVNLTAPGRDGSFRGYWRLRDASGTLFGIGRSGGSFYVDIRVQTPQASDPFDFVGSYCSAEWTTGAGRIPCQGAADDSRGFVRRIESPTLESGYIDDEPVLQTHPQMITDGVIRGRYPAIKIENGHYFVAIIGCANKVNSCDVKFQLDYQIGNSPIQTLASWNEVYDEQFRTVEVDLSGLRGNNVNLILTVFANGSSNQDYAQWLVPRVILKKVPTPEIQ